MYSFIYFTKIIMPFTHHLQKVFTLRTYIVWFLKTVVYLTKDCRNKVEEYSREIVGYYMGVVSSQVFLGIPIPGNLHSLDLSPTLF